MTVTQRYGKPCCIGIDLATTPDRTVYVDVRNHGEKRVVVAENATTGLEKLHEKTDV